ncbi:flagellar basal body rod protein FlgB [Nocardioides mangrovi]|uniref:Flagellar basal body rod protein FlgB n=1 Tax=Nocardioides mangrovi TaxID=2874580 RepID=A0ABS7UAG2_9ACTN|nr:flagellar basal body protein [Nocardioides mangrovi]MBZ5737807.1 flagellar basal body protein [Nocardioides mangrovi]
MSFSLSDPVGAVLNAALDGVALRQRVTADNIANVDTPGYRASSVDFETSLRAAIASGDPGDVSVTTQATDTPVGANDNNVDLREETLTAVQSQFQYQMLTRATTERFKLISTVAAG